VDAEFGFSINAHDVQQQHYCGRGQIVSSVPSDHKEINDLQGIRDAVRPALLGSPSRL
jgi:hypothetical protein